MENYKFDDESLATEEQSRVFDFVENKVGSAIVNAFAGSGKTKTIVRTIDCLRNQKGLRVLFLAHNKSIQETLERKVTRLYGNKKERREKGYNIRIYTYHSLGLHMFVKYMEKAHKWSKQAYKEYLRYKNKEGIYGEYDKNGNSLGFWHFSDYIFDDDKYKKHINDNIKKDEFTHGVYNTLDISKQVSYKQNIKKLVNFGRHNCCQSEKEFKKIAKKYGVITVDNECLVASEILHWGKTYLDKVDFQDLLWLPYELKYGTMWYLSDFIMVDEAQDSSPLQQKLLEKCLARGGRFVAVGDENQAINSFCGSDEKSFKSIKNIQATVNEFNLTTCFRCDKKIIEHANYEVSKLENLYGIKSGMHNITPREDAGEGEIVQNGQLSDIKVDDLVICRYTAPLTELYRKLLEAGIPAHMVGEVRQVPFVDLLRDTHGEEMTDVLDELYKTLIQTWLEVASRTNQEPYECICAEEIDTLYDKILAIEYLNNGIKTKTELLNYIKTAFISETDAETNVIPGVRLSTIHKAKGLEADTVFMVAPKLIPSTFVRLDQEWEKIAETNLMYVAITRAKHKFVYLPDNLSTSGTFLYEKSMRIKKFKELKEKYGL